MVCINSSMWTYLMNPLCLPFMAPSTSFALYLASIGSHSENFPHHPPADDSLSTAGVHSAHLNSLPSSYPTFCTLELITFFIMKHFFLLASMSLYSPVFSSTLYYSLIFHPFLLMVASSQARTFCSRILIPFIW